ncbi:MAG: hypothetical protein JNG84_05950 [Archangium sp.]|nr:hypothetical protein [Archangium sp.]
MLLLLMAASVVAQPPAEETPRLFDALTADYEIGALYFFQNEGRYGADGTRYQASDVGQQRNLFVGQRLSVEAKMRRHTVIALWAPLDVTTRVTLPRDVVFQTTTFAQGAVVDHRYLFDGYRISYLFDVVAASRFTLGLGASLQVRNASVEFKTVDASPAVFAVERDIGLVGALKARLRFDAGVLYAMADVDFFNTFGIGLAGGIHDVALTLGVPLIDGADFFVRLRVVGGGANVPTREIYNWGNFGGAFTGLRLDLPKLLAARQQRAGEAR